MQKHQSAADAIAPVQSGHRVFVHGGAATPLVLLDALVAQAERLRNVELTHLHTHGSPRYADAEFAGHFSVANLFVGANMRAKIDHERVDYVPVFLSETPQLFRRGVRRADVALLSVSPPDRHGYCTLGTSVDVARAVVETTPILIAQINHQMPRVHGDGAVHIDRLAHVVEVDQPLPEHPSHPPTDVEMRIGEFVSSIINDGATLQMGIGAIPDAVMLALKNHRNLGIHTEMFSDGAVELIQSGAVDNSQKRVHPGRSVATFLIGTRKLYDFVNDNPTTLLLDVAYTNNTSVIARNPKVTAINSAVEIDLTGQVCADSIGHTVISGVGGQMDFIRGASIVPDGKPIIALPSRAKGNSRIVPALKPGAGVVTTRAHVHYVITEHGIAELFGKTLNERAHALINIAHPDDRDQLDRAWHDTRRQRG